jgi:hypothetical protein
MRVVATEARRVTAAGGADSGAASVAPTARTRAAANAAAVWAARSARVPPRDGAERRLPDTALHGQSWHSRISPSFVVEEIEAVLLSVF